MHSKVILLQDVPNLGEEGDIKLVARGYARNYLLPRKMVVPHTKANLALLESRREAIEKRKEEKRLQAQGIKERIESTPLTIIMPMGERGRLFGSVTSANIVDELQKLGIIVERKKVEIPDNSIKAQGTYKVNIRLYDNQEASLTVTVNPQDALEEAAESAETPVAEETVAEEAVAEEAVAEETVAEEAVAEEAVVEEAVVEEAETAQEDSPTEDEDR